MIKLIKKILFDPRLEKLKLFILVGIGAVFIDYIFYIGLISVGLNISLSKMIGFLFGISFSFFGNKTFTFVTSFSYMKLFKYSILYLFTLNLNVQINKYFFNILNDFQFATQMAFFVATGFCAVVNFLGLNYFIFSKDKS
jgi:putative flippase GtrA